jgi:outer membrane receptor protein involved in Fe transport
MWNFLHGAYCTEEKRPSGGRQRHRGDIMGYGHSVLLALATNTVIVGAPAVAAPAIQYDIASQDLGDAIRAFAIASHPQVIFSEDQVRGKRSPALKGNYTVDEAFARLLQGSGLRGGRTPDGVLFVSTPGQAVAPAQTLVQPMAADIVITGSRIKQSPNQTAAPQSSFTGQAITERGFTQVGDMLNLITSNAPTFQVAPFAGYPVVEAGRQAPNLFNLGEGRTLSLINGRRMVPSSSGVSGGIVDTNVIPVDLIDRVDVVEAGGAAVYGSGAIAGVVNYILKKSYEGVSIDAQYGISSRGDYHQPSIRVTAGHNFADGRGNIAANVEYSKTTPLFYADRPWSAAGHSLVANDADTGPNDGISSQRNIYDATFYSYNTYGVIYKSVFPDFNFSSDPSRMVMLNGTALQFSPDGQSIVPYDPGTIQSPFGIASGGQGEPLTERSTLYGGTRRISGTVLAHYDFSRAARLSGQFLYGHEEGIDPIGGGNIFKIMGAYPFSESWATFFNKSNPFLTPEEIATLSAASPTFASGGSILLSKHFTNILPSRERKSDTNTWSGVIALDGDFEAAGRHMYYGLSYTHGHTKAVGSDWEQWTDHLTNALSATRNASGDIVCSINAVTVVDSACVPINPFSSEPVSQAAQDYVAVRSGMTSINKLDDVIASLGGDALKLPGGTAKFSLAYEYRKESAHDTPFDADILGLPYNEPTAPEGGSYHTNEYSAELMIPLVGGNFTLPLVQSLEVNGSFRHVDNSLAGKNNVWGVGGRWGVGAGLTFRGTISRNFRAPTLDQLYAPQVTSPQAIFMDPCSKAHIDAGPAPQNRRANCAALFSMHPEWGPLADFQDLNENVEVALVTSGGNPNLQNEISHTKTLGAVWDPSYIPGLSLAVDWISLNLENGLVSFSPASFFTKCVDTSPQDQAACSTFTRDSRGFIDTALSGYANAGYIKYRGQTFKAKYELRLNRILSGNPGVVTFAAEATHTSRYEESDTGFAVDAYRNDGTVSYPDWRTRFDINYYRGPLSLFYSVSYYPPEKSGYYDTIETTPNWHVGSNFVHSASIQYQLHHLSLRAGVTNIFDRAPSFPTFTYGDALGRRFFVGANLHF